MIRNLCLHIFIANNCRAIFYFMFTRNLTQASGMLWSERQQQKYVFSRLSVVQDNDLCWIGQQMLDPPMFIHVNSELRTVYFLGRII